MIISGYSGICYKDLNCPNSSYRCALECLKQGNQHGGDCRNGEPICCCKNNV